MTTEMEAQIEAIVAETGMKAADIQALGDPNATEDDLALLLRTYRDAGAITSVSVFDRIVAALKIGSEIAGDVVPVVNLATSLRTLFTGL